MTNHVAAFALTGRRALITGATGGIGRAIAGAYGAAGADLVLLSDEDPEPMAAELRAGGTNASAVRLDLASRGDRAQLLGEVTAEEKIDVAVHCAGRIERAPVADMSDDSWYGVFEVNLHAAFDLVRAVGQPMLRRGHGKIINVASLLSFQGGLNAASYAASKHALAGFTRALANEWAGRGINVNALAPGYVVTDLAAPLYDDPERSQEITGRIPAGRWAKPEDVAGPAVFLAAPASDYVHGHVLMVDGGWMSR